MIALITGWAALAAMAPQTPPQSAPTVAPEAAMLPARTLTCTLGRIANFDTTKNQKPSDFVFEGSHDFRLFLPPTPVRTSEPPDSTSAPEPVDPRTRVLADPDGLMRAQQQFDRVVDYWPDRVEMTTVANDAAVNLIIIDAIDPAQGRANLFLAKATDAVTFDFARMFAGGCRVTG